MVDKRNPVEAALADLIVAIACNKDEDEADAHALADVARTLQLYRDYRDRRERKPVTTKPRRKAEGGDRHGELEWPAYVATAGAEGDKPAASAAPAADLMDIPPEFKR